jgi:hypothetical protein
VKVEKADVHLNLPGLIRFLLAHFRDVPLLKEYLEICKPLPRSHAVRLFCSSVDAASVAARPGQIAALAASALSVSITSCKVP